MSGPKHMLAAVMAAAIAAASSQSEARQRSVNIETLGHVLHCLQSHAADGYGAPKFDKMIYKVRYVYPADLGHRKVTGEES